MNEIQDLIDQFIAKHLSDEHDTLGKLQEEVKEFIEDPGVLEGADILICVMIKIREQGGTLNELFFNVYEKMRLNLTRTWERQPDGTLHHVKKNGE